MGRIGILTLHHSYNCGSMLQAFALQETLERMGHEVRVINFSNEGQARLYSVLERPTSLKRIAKDVLLAPRAGRIRRNFAAYERFMTEHLHLDGPVVRRREELDDAGYDAVVAGSDQVWNVTIEDGDDAYFLPWVTRARRVAYAPSFGARSPARFARDPRVHADWLRRFDALSVRERNGRRWIRELIGVDAPVLLDPTLLLDAGDYAPLEHRPPGLPGEYLFYYAPSYSRPINRFVAAVARRHGLAVIAFNAKTFHVKGMALTGFRLPAVESPAVYLALIRGAAAVVTTSFHGTVFSTIYRRPFWTVKNGGMYHDDDRVLTLLEALGLRDRLVPPSFERGRDWLAAPDFEGPAARIARGAAAAREFLAGALPAGAR